MAWINEIYDLLHDPNTICIANISFGKDSNAMLRAIKLLGLPLHYIVHTQVWATDTIPADLPPMMDFKAKASEIIKELYGLDVISVCATDRQTDRQTDRESHTMACFTGSTAVTHGTKPYTDFLFKPQRGATSSNTSGLTYEKVFYRIYDSGEREGRMYGFPYQRGNWCQSRLKAVNCFPKAPCARGRR